MRRTYVALLILATVVVTATIACSTGARTVSSKDGKVHIVAAENFWGSIAQQLGGDHVAVTEIINSPDADPHDYEPTAGDARTIATARYVIVNGLGYDSWASDLLDANESNARTVLDVGDLLGLKTGDNPHRWYFPDDVSRVIDRITTDLQSIDPSHSSYYAQRHDEFSGATLRGYHDLLSQIRTAYAGTPVGASESIVQGLTQAAGLDLKTPQSFLDAIADGNGPSAADKITVDDQISSREIAVFIYNSQNATPDVQRLVDEARAKGIPVATITETPVPANAAFQDWQTAQLQQLSSALAESKQ
jgi:zinc/manganese transport system substrate-binding protein